MRNEFLYKTDVLGEVERSLGDFAADFDIEAIADEAYAMTPKHTFVQSVDADEFWTIVEQHAIN